jgi:hypothetical protein
MEWGTQRPESYDPLCFLIPEDSTSCPFWDVRLHADWHGKSTSRPFSSTYELT